ncbi:hypothetical protein [Acinetobacter bereziniae]|uniref:hypothetical protein n=1 Tax=Acinetobacter bereziniae TaxID=106648 RepID=UPI0012506569|nr:hypothetical protein [Acinetobacter bereziniae]
MGINLEKLNLEIEKLKQFNKPTKLVVGYLTFSKLIKNDEFFKELNKNIANPMVKYYRGLKVVVVTEKYFFSIE